MASGEAVLLGTPTDSEAFMQVLNTASPMQWVDIERQGVDATVLGDLAKRMEVSYSHLAETVGIPKATAARKLANNEKINGAAAIALARLLAMASDIVADSTSPEAETFNTAKWLGQWIEQPQPALGGRKPSDLLDTPTGVAMVTKLLGAVRSGAYQ
jgi:putative toxin-antitoxin system antitoxin component (TIGR02293 family)